MSPTRREFIKHLAMALASLAMTRCLSPGDDSSRSRLRSCWLQLDPLAQQTHKDYERGSQMKDQLVADHRAALDTLIAAGELSAAVAAQMQAAFVEAAYHVWRANAPMTCYEPVLVDYTPTGASQLVQQANLLAEMAERGDLDPSTVAQARAAIERDIAFLGLSDEETQALYDELIKAAGDAYTFPAFDELEMEILPEAAEAARFLVELLLEE